MGDGIVAYLQGIDATLAPFGGRFIIHGDEKTMLEGDWHGNLIGGVDPDHKATDILG